MTLRPCFTINLGSLIVIINIVSLHIYSVNIRSVSLHIDQSKQRLTPH
jgi:hypothetical protein